MAPPRLYQRPVYFDISPFWLLDVWTTPIYVCILHTVWPTFCWSLLQPSDFLLCMHTQILSQRLKQLFCSSLECSLYETHSSPILCPADSTILVSPNSDLCPPNLVSPLSSVLFPLPPLWPGNSLQAVSWSNCKSHFIYLPSLREHHPTFSVVHCLKTIVSYNRSSFLIAYRKREIPIGFPG